VRLHDVEDARALVASIVRRSELTLTREDREDLEQTLLIAVWQLALDFDPGSGRPFGPLAAAVLRRRIVDFQRSQFRTKWVFRDRVHTRQRPQFFEFNDSARARLDAVESARAGDSAPGGDADWRGLLDDRSRCRAEDFDLLGIEDVA
jgi:DNA-directed RNA polymerase specialized sigma24 family protein